MSLLDSYLEQKQPPHPAPSPFHPKGIDGADLCEMELGEIKWAIQGLIPEGAALLAGAPKLGKSWFALNLALAIAHGGVALGRIQVEKGPVLYLALEDGPRRLQKRLKKILQASGMPCPRGIEFHCRWPRCKEGGLAALKERMEALKPRLVIIDTLARIQDARTGSDNAYVTDYAVVAPLQELALEMNIAVLLVTHVRKRAALSPDNGDPIEDVSGSMGITGAADVVLVLKRPRQNREATLFLTGRDIEENEIPMEWNPQYGLWTMRDTEEGPRLSTEQRRVLKILDEAQAPMNILDIMAKANTTKNYEAFAKMVRRMAADGVIHRDGNRGYVSKMSKPSDPTPDNLDNSDIGETPDE